MSKEFMITRTKTRELMNRKEFSLFVEKCLNDLKAQLQFVRDEESLSKEKSGNDSFENSIDYWFATLDIAEEKKVRIKNYFDVI